jgi:hypothetical protein
MTVGDLRKAIAGVPDSTEIVVRTSEERDDGDAFICAPLVSADVEPDHCGEDPPFLVLEADASEVEVEVEVEKPALRLVKKED